ncbi:hypothetical protein J7E97_08920 [Streptomyces sp. ISL-66]|uniref:hypothetical protein n=1 Tax=Streptomyces sp. ISL-66 TaxID=2819186 RepID=UPI001BE92AF7|nr:hypothetical protein [Streptomyces sp. ISL-66]MBT2467998.1 hypothetical protein [Streptomyces sp. ISL-66]
MSGYTKPLVAAAIGALIILFGFTPDFGDGAKECAGHDMQPGDSCVGSHGAYGYDDIAAEDAENRRNKKMILSVIGGAVILGALGFAVRAGVEDVQFAGERRRSDARHRARVALDTWDRPPDPGTLEERSQELPGGGRVELYTHALCYKPGTGSREERWVRWDRVTYVEDSRARLQYGNTDYTLLISAEGNVEPLKIGGFTGDQEFVSRVGEIAVEAAKPKVYEALNNAGAFRLSPADPDLTALLNLPGILPLHPELLLTAGGFISREPAGNRPIPWSQITKFSKQRDVGHPLAVIARRGATPAHFALATTADLAAFKLAQDLWKRARRG